MRSILKKLSRDQITAIIIFFASIGAFILYLYVRVGKSALMSVIPDGRLYISISDNFLATGHFTQTVRPRRINMVAPFGLPVLLLPIRLLTKSNIALLIIQYILFGCINVFAFFSERNLIGTRGIFSLAFTMFAAMYRYEASPSVICCPEIWFMFFLFAALYVLSLDIKLPRKLTWLNILTFIAMAIRPFLSPFYIVVLAYTVYAFISGQISLRRTALTSLIPCSVLLAFLLINHHESGVFVLFENYASIDMVAANNPSSTPSPVSIMGFYSTVSATDAGVDFATASDEYRAIFRSYIAEYPGKFISDTLSKFYQMYIQHWFFIILPVIASGIILMLRDKKRRMLYCILLVLPIAMGLFASVGLLMHRYTVYVVPFWCILLAGGIKNAADIYRRRDDYPAYVRLRRSVAGLFSR